MLTCGVRGAAGAAAGAEMERAAGHCTEGECLAEGVCGTADFTCAARSKGDTLEGLAGVGSVLGDMRESAPLRCSGMATVPITPVSMLGLGAMSTD